MVEIERRNRVFEVLTSLEVAVIRGKHSSDSGVIATRQAYLFVYEILKSEIFVALILSNNSCNVQRA